MRCGMGADERERVPLIRKVYDMWGERNVAALTGERAQAIAVRVSQMTGQPVGRCEVARWLRRPDEFSPFVDEVAIERALEGDWGVIDRLSRLEVSVLIDRLAAMRDPFSSGEPESWRAERWATGPEEARCYLIRKVHLARWEHNLIACVGEHG